MISIKPSVHSELIKKKSEEKDAEWAHQEAKRLLAKKAPPEYLFEEERSENIHLYERTIINHPMNHGDTKSGI
jgi:hypothetical protein